MERQKWRKEFKERPRLSQGRTVTYIILGCGFQQSHRHTTLKSYKQKRIEAVNSVKSGCHFSHVVMSVIIRIILYYSAFSASTLTETNIRKVRISSFIIYINYTSQKANLELLRHAFLIFLNLRPINLRNLFGSTLKKTWKPWNNASFATSFWATTTSS